MVKHFFLAGMAIFFGICAADTSSSLAEGRPVARISEAIICCPRDSVLFDGWASLDLGGEVVGWIWDLDGDGSPDTTASTGELVIMASDTPRTSTVILKVRDNEGNVSAPDSSTFHIMNSPPYAFAGNDTVIKPGVRVSFSPKVTYNCGYIKRYEWDFNDDGIPEYQSAENGRTSRQYFKFGRYYARLKVTDCFGREAGGIRTIIVTRNATRFSAAREDSLNPSVQQ